MHIPYTVKELDDLINACIQYVDAYNENQFYTGNISSRMINSEEETTAHLQKKMDWIVELDKGILEGLGRGNDNIYYYSLGVNAKQLMRNGGFRKYLNDLKRSGDQKKIQEWSPVLIAFFALLISILTWLYPRSGNTEIEKLKSEMEIIKKELRELKMSRNSASGDIKGI